MIPLPLMSIKLTREDVVSHESASSSSFPVKELDRALREANELIRPSAACQWVRVVSLKPGFITVCPETSNDQTPYTQTTATQTTLETGEPSHIWRHARKILVSVVTIGPFLDQRIRERNLLRDPLGGYLLDCAGLAALKKAGTLVCRLAEKEALTRKWGVGYQVGPGGTAGWDLKDQAKVCSLVSLDPIGVTLDAQGGLSPLKTISSLIPIGPGYKRNTVGSTCRYCGSRETCNIGDIYQVGVKERKKREKVDRKAQILGAARTLLFSKGLGGTSVNGIAALVELSVPAIYRYYKNKDEIIFDLSEEGLQLLQKEITQAVEAANAPSQKLAAIAMAYRNFSTTQKDYFTVINHFLASPETVLPEQLKHKIDHHGEQILMQVVAAIEEGVQSGELICEDSRRFSLMFWGAINGIIQLQKIEHTIFAGKDHGNLYRHTVETLIASLRIPLV